MTRKQIWVKIFCILEISTHIQCTRSLIILSTFDCVHLGLVQPISFIFWAKTKPLSCAQTSFAEDKGDHPIQQTQPALASDLRLALRSFFNQLTMVHQDVAVQIRLVWVMDELNLLKAHDSITF